MIAEFCKRTGLTKDTVRFYVRKGLLHPTVGASGSNRYQTFAGEDVARALLIRFGQQLGFTLREIVALEAEFGDSAMPVLRQREMMIERLTGVERQIESLQGLRDYFRSKIAWLDAGAVGTPPPFVLPRPRDEPGD